MGYRTDGIFYSGNPVTGNHYFSATAEEALNRSLSEGSGRRILVQRNVNVGVCLNFLELEKQGLKALARTSTWNYYSLRDAVRLARINFPKEPCTICGKLIRPDWIIGTLEEKCFLYNNEWTRDERACHQEFEERYRNGQIAHKSSYNDWEQQYQDAYCSARGIPVKRQRHPGIDYFHETCGWLEFVRDGLLEEKDYIDYPAAIADESYTVIFVGRPPGKHKIEKLTSRAIQYEISAVKI